MNQTLEASLRRPRVTVAALVCRDNRFLFVEERDVQGNQVINQPAGHLECGESVLEGVVRETLEETAWHVKPLAVVGVYLWAPPDSSSSYLRVAVEAEALRFEPDRPLDEGIEQAVWMTLDELKTRQAQHRSPLVLRCVEDFLAKERFPLSLLKSL